MPDVSVGEGLGLSGHWGAEGGRVGRWLPVTPLPLGQDNGFPHTVQRPRPQHSLGVSAGRAGSRGSGLPRACSRVLALWQLVPRVRAAAVKLGWGWGVRVGLALRVELAQRCTARGRCGLQEGRPAEEGASSSAWGSHLVRMDGGREEAAEVGEKLLGPPLRQQGGLGGNRTEAWGSSVPAALPPVAASSHQTLTLLCPRLGDGGSQARGFLLS